MLNGISNIEHITKYFSGENEYGPLTKSSAFNDKCAKVSMSKSITKCNFVISQDERFGFDIFF